MSEDRWTYPARDEDPRQVDREMSDGDLAAIKEATRAVTHPQERERTQGTSADSPGIDPSDRERADDGGTPTGD
jgi:hypothetical protein